MAVTLFTGTVVNKVDRKGRVSVPAGFRNELAGQSFHGVAIYPSVDKSPSLTGCGEDRLRNISDALGGDDPFDTESVSKRMRLFPAVQRLPFDADGRVLLPRDLLIHAGITTHAAFSGMGHEFRIWEPETLKAVRNAEEEQSSEDSAEPERPPAPGADR